MKSTKSQYCLNHEQWKYTKINHFKDYNFNYTPDYNLNKIVNKKCQNNEILLYNGKFIQAGNEINRNNIIVYNESAPSPFDIEDRNSASEEHRLRYRYLELRTKELQKNLILNRFLLKVWQTMEVYSYLIPLKNLVKMK